MATTIQHEQARVGTAGGGVPGAVSEGGRQQTASRLTTEQVWHQVAKASFAVLGYVTPSGEPRSSGVVYRMIEGRLYVAVVADRDAYPDLDVFAAGGREELQALGVPTPPTSIRPDREMVTYDNAQC